MATSTRPFSGFEFMIAWRYLRARRAEGGVSVMTWISLIGITLAVFALIATMAVRAGFREEFVDTILGANAHVTVYSAGELDADGRLMRGFADTGEIGTALAAVPGVVEAAPVVRGQVMVSDGEENSGAEVYGMRPEDFATIPAMHEGGDDLGEIGDFPNGLALGSGVARELGVTVGDRVRLISPNGVKSALGSTPRVNAYDVVYVFNTGSPDIDRTRAYLPLSEAQAFFNAEGRLDEFQVMVEHPEEIDSYGPALMAAGGPEAMLWSWKDSSGAFLRALTVEDNMMFILMSILVLIA
ncbi:MAG: ABC transporter permease, partial [Tabrizicola sp.]